MDEMGHTVSVVMATYNGERYLAEQLDSILSQTYPIHEIIISDDCSTDSTKLLIEKYAEQYPFIHTYYNNINIGFKKNFDKACTYATGEYVALCDQDDIWLPNHIEILIDLAKKSGVGLVCGNSLIVDSNNQSLGYTLEQAKRLDYVPKNSVQKAYHIFYYTGCYQGASMLMKAEFLRQALPIPDNVLFHDVWLSTLACLFCGFEYTSTVITRYRQHGNNVTTNVLPSLYKELKRHTHSDYVHDRIVIAHALSSHNYPISDRGSSFIAEFIQYAARCTSVKYRFWCWRFRSRHYKEIYGTTSYKYYVLRAGHFLLTPSSNKAY